MTNGVAGFVHRKRRSRSLLANSATVASWTFVSRITGFMRMATIGAVLGPTFFGNLFQAANQVPNLAFELVAGQLIASLLVPALVRPLDAGDRVTTERIAGGFLGVVVAVFGLAAVVLAAAAPAVVALLGIGISNGEVRAAQTSLAWPLLVAVMPQLVLYGLIGVANAVQNARGQYRLAAAAPVLENVGVIATLGAYAVIFDAGTEVADATTGNVLFLGLGCTASVAAHAALQWWGARQASVTLRPRAGWRDPDVRAIVRRAVPSLGLAAATGYQGFAVLIVAGRTPGGVVASQLALGFLAAVVAVAARPVAVAALPDLARDHRDGRRAAFRTSYRRSLALALFALAPAAAALAALSGPLAAGVTFGEMSATTGVELVAAILPLLALGCLGEGGASVAQQACYARLDTATPWRASLLRTVALTVGLTAAWFAADGPTILALVGAAVSAASLVAFLRLHFDADRLIPLRPTAERPTALCLEDLSILPSTLLARGESLSRARAIAGRPAVDEARLARRATATLLAAAVATAAGYGIAALLDNTVGALAALLGGGAVLAVCYLCLQAIARAPELAAVTRRLRRQGRRRPPHAPQDEGHVATSTSQEAAGNEQPGDRRAGHTDPPSGNHSGRGSDAPLPSSAAGAATSFPAAAPVEPALRQGAPPHSPQADPPPGRTSVDPVRVAEVAGATAVGMVLGSMGGSSLSAVVILTSLAGLMTNTGSFRRAGRMRPVDVAVPAALLGLLAGGWAAGTTAVGAMAAYWWIRLRRTAEPDGLVATWLAVGVAAASLAIGFATRAGSAPALLIPVAVASAMALTVRRAAMAGSGVNAADEAPASVP